MQASGLIIFNNQHSAVTWSHFGGRPTPRHVQYASAAMFWVSSQMNAALEKDASPEVRCLFVQKSPRMHHFILNQMPCALKPVATPMWRFFFFSCGECRFSLLCSGGHPPGGHPDEDGHHLRIVASLLKKHLQNFREQGVKDAGIFWDFGSLFQKEHEGNQKQLFDEGLRASNLWYGSTKTTVWTRSQSPKSCCV